MNRGIRSLSLIVLLSALGAAAWAGPLDRGSSGPRVNPETNSMLRVPGVVGLDYQSALATLQQAGLTPRLHFIRRPSPRYQGREGQVVGQLPLPGGMAMLGSSVTIRVYQPPTSPGQEPPDYNAAPPGYGDSVPGTESGLPAASGGYGGTADTGAGTANDGYGQAPAGAPQWQPDGNGAAPAAGSDGEQGYPAGNGQSSWQPAAPPASGAAYGSVPQGSADNGLSGSTPP